MKYIHLLKDWPRFYWRHEQLETLLATVRYRQGKVLGRMESLGFELANEATLHTLTLEVVKSNEIEGELLQPEQVRSSIARRLGIDTGALLPADRSVEGVVEMTIDASRNFAAPLTRERLFNWHAAMFPTGRSGMYPIVVGNWRNAEKGPMQVVSGPLGRERVHFEAPDGERLETEMQLFLDWFNKQTTEDLVMKAGIAHLWFVTIHPFDDGNGRIGRTITDMQLARSEGTGQRFYSLLAQIRKERAAYYEILERTQCGSLDITTWLEWFLTCMDRALTATEGQLTGILNKARFWDQNRSRSFNPRQKEMLNKLLDGFDGKLNSSKWAKITKCSQDTALRDIQDLLEKGLLIREESGGRSTSYLLAPIA